MPRPALTERDLRIMLETLTLRAHRMWLAEPTDRSRYLPLCEDLFDLQIQIQRLELKLQAGSLRDEHITLLATITSRLDQLEVDWQKSDSTNSRKEPLPWT